MLRLGVMFVVAFLVVVCNEGTGERIEGAVFHNSTRRPWPTSLLGRAGSGSVLFDFPIGCDFSGFFVELLGILQAVPEARFPAFDSCSLPFVQALEHDRDRVAAAAATSSTLRSIQPAPSNAKIVVRLHSIGSACSKPPTDAVYVLRTMSEADKVPERDLVCFCSGAVDALFVPTSWHQKLYQDALRAHREICSVSLPAVYVVGETVNMELFSPKREDDDGSGDRFIIFSNSRFSREKGVDRLLRAFWKAFVGDSACMGEKAIPLQGNVELRLRVYVPGWGPFDNKHRSASSALLAVAMAYIEETCADGHGDVARLVKDVTLVPSLSRVELAREYRSASVFALASGGEGWGLPPMEAIAAGVQTVIVTEAAAFSARSVEEWARASSATPSYSTTILSHELNTHTHTHTHGYIPVDASEPTQTCARYTREHYISRTAGAAADAASNEGECPSPEYCCARVVTIPCNRMGSGGFCLADTEVLANELLAAAHARWGQRTHCPPQCTGCRHAARRALEREFGADVLRSTLIESLIDVVRKEARDEL